MPDHAARSQKNSPYSRAAGSSRILIAAKAQATAENAVHHAKACLTLILSRIASKPYNSTLYM